MMFLSKQKSWRRKYNNGGKALKASKDSQLNFYLNKTAETLWKDSSNVLLLSLKFQEFPRKGNCITRQVNIWSKNSEINSETNPMIEDKSKYSLLDNAEITKLYTNLVDSLRNTLL